MHRIIFMVLNALEWVENSTTVPLILVEKIMLFFSSRTKSSKIMIAEKNYL